MLHIKVAEVANGFIVSPAALKAEYFEETHVFRTVAELTDWLAKNSACSRQVPEHE